MVAEETIMICMDTSEYVGSLNPYGLKLQIDCIRLYCTLITSGCVGLDEASNSKLDKILDCLKRCYFPLKGDGNFAEVIDVCLLFYPPEKASNQRRILFFIAGPLDDEISSYGAEWRGEMFKTNGVAVDLFLFGVPECYTHYKVLKTFVDAANYNGNSHIAHLKVNSQTSPSEILSSAPDIFPLEEEGEITSNKKAKDAKGKNQAAAAAHDEHVKADNHKMNSSKKKRSKRKRDGV